MKPTPIFAAAAGFAIIGACTVKTEDNGSQNMDPNVTATTSENAAPVPGNSADSDTLGNQLNQLTSNESEAQNSTD